MESILQTPIGPLPPALATKVLAFYGAFCSPVDERYLWFAAHAAFPVALTPDLAYKIWLNFRKDEQEKPESLGIPLIAVSDLLLSPLYRPTGRDIYEMHPDLRAALLQYLKGHPHFGPRRLDLLARFLKFYLRENRPRIPTQAFLEAQEFVCNAHLEPQRAAEQLLALWNRQADKTRFRQLLSWSEQEVQLEGATAHDKAEANPLGVAVQLVKGVQQFQAGNKEEAVELLKGLKGIASRERQEGIAVEMPQGVLEVLPQEFLEEKSKGNAPSGTGTRYAKMHLLTPAYENQIEVAKKLFDVDISPLSNNSLKCYQWEIERDKLNQWPWKVQIWQFADDIPEVIDHFLFTKNGFYVIWVPDNFENFTNYLDNWLRRLHIQLGHNNIWLILPDGFDLKLLDGYKNWVASFRDIWELIEDWNLWRELWYFKEVDNFSFPYERVLIEVQNHYSGWGKPMSLAQVSNSEELETAGLIRLFPGNWNVESKMLIGPSTWFAKINQIFTDAQKKEGALFLESMNDDGDSIEHFIAGYYLFDSIQESKNILFFPHVFLQAFPDFYLDFPTRPTTYFILTFDFLPADFRNRLAYALLKGGSAVLLANRLPIVIGIDGYVVQFEYYPERRALHLLLTRPDAKMPTFFADIKKSPLHSIFFENWDSLKKSPSIKPEELIQSLTNALDSAISTYPYPITFTSKTLHIPAHATPALEMVFVKGGTFTMGDVMGDKEWVERELPLQEVTLGSFRIGRFAVTFDEYDAFCEATGREKPGDEDWGRGRRPVINVSWYDAVEYCNWLSEIWNLEPAYTIDKNKQDINNTSDYDNQKWLVTFNPKARGYRLPTEAQWEYAARQCGEEVRFGNGKDVVDSKEINFYASKDYKKSYSVESEYRGKTVPVGSLNSPNELGLHDMSGNVWEWCWDWFGNYSSDVQTDPTGPLRGSNRVNRGGSWGAAPEYCRVAFRNNRHPGFRINLLGFRLVLPPVTSE